MESPLDFKFVIHFTGKIVAVKALTSEIYSN